MGVKGLSPPHASTNLTNLVRKFGAASADGAVSIPSFSGTWLLSGSRPKQLYLELICKGGGGMGRKERGLSFTSYLLHMVPDLAPDWGTS